MTEPEIKTEPPLAPAKPSPRAAALANLTDRAKNFEKGDLGTYGQRLAGLAASLEEVTASLDSMRALVQKGEAMEAKLAENGKLLDQIIGIGGQIFDAAESFDAEAVAVLQADMTEIKTSLQRLTAQGGGANSGGADELASLARDVSTLKASVKLLREAAEGRREDEGDGEEAGGVDTLETDVRDAVLAKLRLELPSLVRDVLERGDVKPAGGVDRESLERVLFDIDPEVFQFLGPDREPVRADVAAGGVAAGGDPHHPARAAAREAAQRALADEEG